MNRCHGRASGFEVERIVYDESWDLFGYAGWSPRLQAMVVSFRGTDSHSIYNWAENMRYWRTDFKVPFPGSDGSKVHTGEIREQCTRTLETCVLDVRCHLFLPMALVKACPVLCQALSLSCHGYKAFLMTGRPHR